MFKKKVWIINHYASNTFFDEGGRHFYFAKYLKKAGYEPIIFCSNAKHNTNKELFFNLDGLYHIDICKKIDVPYVFVKGKGYLGNGINRIINMFDFYINIRNIADNIVKVYGKPDVIYASSVHPLSLLAGIKLAKRYNIKCISEIRDLWPESLFTYDIIKRESLIGKLLLIFEKYIYNKSNALIFTMEGAAEYIKNNGWINIIDQKKIYYINNGVDAEDFEYNKNNYIINDNDINSNNYIKIVYAGSLRKANSVDIIISAAKLLQNKKIKILIWGHGDDMQLLADRIINEGIDNVVLKGKIEKKFIPYILSKSNYNLIDKFDGEISKYGISANKMFEYLAASKPIIMSKLDKYNPIGNSKGTIFYNNTIEGLANVLDSLTDITNDKYNDMCKDISLLAKHYYYEILTDKLISVINNLDKETDY